MNAPSRSAFAQRTVFPVLLAISFSHLLNDTVQALIPAIYPVVKDGFHLSFAEIGLITLTFQLTASLLQPFVGHFTDKRPQPYSLIAGMCFSLAGLLALARAGSFPAILAAVALVGVGSSIFHPEASRMAHLAAGGRRGLAQAVFQLGGNAGSALGPLLAALIIVPLGQAKVSWFALLPLIAIAVLWQVAGWYKRHSAIMARRPRPVVVRHTLPRRQVAGTIAVLLALIFSKQVYLACITSYFTFFLIDKFHLPVQDAQLYLFLFLFAVAAGTLIGGPIGDRYGRKHVIWASILGAAPFTLLLPYVGLFWVSVLSVLIGLILSSAFSAILVYAQELLPGKVGMVAGLFFGFAFGMAGIGSALLGKLADATSITHVFHVCAYLPLIGLAALFLPRDRTPQAAG